jgi:hypothetical protein
MKVMPLASCQCGSWLKHWEKHSGQTLSFCVEMDCMEKNLVGALVQKVNPLDNDWYIIPLCHVHCAAPGEIEISDNYRLVAGDTMENCDSMRVPASPLLPLPLSGSPRSY